MIPGDKVILVDGKHTKRFILQEICLNGQIIASILRRKFDKDCQQTVVIFSRQKEVKSPLDGYNSFQKEEKPL